MRIKLIEELPMATSAELYQLSWVIEQLLADPRRLVQVRAQLHHRRRVAARVRADDQADAVLQVLVGEGHPVSDAEVGTAWNLRWWAQPGEFHVCRCRTAFS
jgi:hypothetical protein